MAFNPDEFLKQEDSEFNPDEFLKDSSEPTQKDIEEASRLGALARGAAQGLTFGFEDEIRAGLGAVGSEISDLFTGKEENIADKYRRLVADIRKANKAAEEAHGGLFLTGEIAGGIAPALLTGGSSLGISGAKTGGKLALKELMKQGAKTGAKYGAAYGLGKSEADLTKGEVGQALGETLAGGATGAFAGAALPAAIRGISEIAPVGKIKGAGEKASEWMLDKGGKLFRKTGKAFSKARSGETVRGEAIGDLAQAEMEKAARFTAKMGSHKMTQSNKLISEGLSGKDKNITTTIFNLEDDLMKLEENAILPEDKQVITNILSFLENNVRGGENKDIIINPQKIYDIYSQLEKVIKKTETLEVPLKGIVRNFKNNLLADLAPAKRQMVENGFKNWQLIHALEETPGVSKYLFSRKTGDVIDQKMINKIKTLRDKFSKLSGFTSKEKLANQPEMRSFFENMEKLYGKAVADKIKNLAITGAERFELSGEGAAGGGGGRLIATLTGGLESVGTAAGATAGHAARIAEQGINKLNFGQKIIDMSAHSLKKLGMRANSAGSPKIADFFNNLSKQTTQQGKQALLFSAMQNPEMKKSILEVILGTGKFAAETGKDVAVGTKEVLLD